MMYYMSFCSNESCSKGICPLFNVTDVGVGFFCGGGWMDGRTPSSSSSAPSYEFVRYYLSATCIAEKMMSQTTSRQRVVVDFRK